MVDKERIGYAVTNTDRLGTEAYEPKVYATVNSLISAKGNTWRPGEIVAEVFRSIGPGRVVARCYPTDGPQDPNDPEEAGYEFTEQAFGQRLFGKRATTGDEIPDPLRILTHRGVFAVCLYEIPGTVLYTYGTASI